MSRFRRALPKVARLAPADQDRYRALDIDLLRLGWYPGYHIDHAPLLTDLKSALALSLGLKLKPEVSMTITNQSTDRMEAVEFAWLMVWHAKNIRDLRLLRVGDERSGFVYVASHEGAIMFPVTF